MEGKLLPNFPMRSALTESEFSTQIRDSIPIQILDFDRRWKISASETILLFQWAAVNAAIHEYRIMDKSQ